MPASWFSLHEASVAKVAEAGAPSLVSKATVHGALSSSGAGRSESVAVFWPPEAISAV